MGRYANAIVRMDFPDLSEDGDLIFVAIRNPKILTLDQLTPADVPNGPDGQPDDEALKAATFEMIAKLIKDWHVYDANDDSDDAPELTLPATAESLRKVPFEIVGWITEQVAAVTTPPQ